MTVFERRNNGECLTIKDLRELVEWSKKVNLSDTTPILISQTGEQTETPAKDLKADYDSIIIYDWI